MGSQKFRTTLGMLGFVAVFCPLVWAGEAPKWMVLQTDTGTGLIDAIRFVFPTQTGNPDTTIMEGRMLGEWAQYGRIRTTYNANGDTEEVFLEIRENASWNPDSDREYLYGPDGRLQEVVILFYGLVFTDSERIAFTYDDRGRCESVTKSYHISGEWTLDDRDIFSYEGTASDWVRDTTLGNNGSWHPVYLTIRLRDSEGKVLKDSSLSVGLDGLLYPWRQVCYSYDPFGRLIQMDSEELSGSSQWEIWERRLYYYESLYPGLVKQKPVRLNAAFRPAASGVFNVLGQRMDAGHLKPRGICINPSEKIQVRVGREGRTVK